MQITTTKTPLPQVTKQPTTKRVSIKEIFLNENLNIYKIKVNYHKELSGIWLIFLFCINFDLI